MRCNDDGHGAGLQGDGVVVIADGDAVDRRDVGVTEGIAQQFAHVALGECRGLDITALALAGEMLPLRAGDLKGAADVVLELEALGGAVVGFGLKVRGTKRGFFQQVGQEQRAFQTQGVKGQVLARAVFHGDTTWMRRLAIADASKSARISCRAPRG